MVNAMAHREPTTPGNEGKRNEEGITPEPGGSVSGDDRPTLDRTLVQAREMALGGLVIALGVVVPIIFHAVGSGPIFLPMHLPILAGAMLLPAGTAALVGCLTPLLSAALTGMPPISPPIAPFMSLELACIAAAASVLHRRLGMSALLATIGAALCGRAVYAAELFLVAPLIGVKLPAAAAGAVALLRAWPGIVLQVLVVPPAVALLSRRGRSVK